MSTQLIEALQKVRITQGKKGILALAKKAKLSATTVRNIENGRLPLAANAYSLARACGMSEAEALDIAKQIDVARSENSSVGST